MCYLVVGDFDDGPANLVDQLSEILGLLVLVLETMLDDSNDFVVGVTVVVQEDQTLVAMLERIFQVGPGLLLFLPDLPLGQFVLPQACQRNDVLQNNLEYHPGSITDIRWHLGQDIR